jgi:hypothetical protein
VGQGQAKIGLSGRAGRVQNARMAISAIDDDALARASQDVLSWIRPRVLSREHELHAGDAVLGTLKLSGVFGREATAECAGRRWRFRRGSLIRREVRVLDENDRPVALYRGRLLGGGELRMETGDVLHWRAFGFWRRTWGFTRDGGDPLVLFRFRFSPGHALDEVTVDADARRLPALPLLLLLGRYLTLRRRRQSHAS